MRAHHRPVHPLVMGALTLGFFALSLFGVARVDAQTTPQAGQTTEKVELLFVQNGTSGTYDGKRLTLTGVGATIFFADRAYRLTGQVRTTEFISHWDKGSDNFA